MWSNLKEVKKGNKGEKIIQDYLEITNHNVYVLTSNKPHWFDGMATKNKEKVFFYEVKTKPKMLSYEAQGFDKDDYKVYLNLYNKTKTPLIVFFVDCKNGNVHSVNFKKLITLTETKEVEYQDKSIIAWNLKHLDLLFKLTNEQINSFKIE
tara:strand:+ start:1064 stop:1516 length:453 start_codon:yes stop_codon:yes gene_type:complete